MATNVRRPRWLHGPPRPPARDVPACASAEPAAPGSDRPPCSDRRRRSPRAALGRRRRPCAGGKHRRPCAIPAPRRAAAVVLAPSPRHVGPPPPRARPRSRPPRAAPVSFPPPPPPRAGLGEKKGRRWLREARVWLGGRPRLAGLGLRGLAKGFYPGEIFCGPTRQKQVDMQVGCPVDASGKGTAL
jgi:hypothetical protein